jgi:hypothetical protein
MCGMRREIRITEMAIDEKESSVKMQSDVFGLLSVSALL